MTTVLEELAEEMNTELIIKELKDVKSAQENSLYPYSTFCVFSNGEFLTRMPYSKEDVTKALGITLKESEENE